MPDPLLAVLLGWICFVLWVAWSFASAMDHADKRAANGHRLAKEFEAGARWAARAPHSPTPTEEVPNG